VLVIVSIHKTQPKKTATGRNKTIGKKAGFRYSLFKMGIVIIIFYISSSTSQSLIKSHPLEQERRAFHGTD
jgi:hypothetical protein